MSVDGIFPIGMKTMLRIVAGNLLCGVHHLICKRTARSKLFLPSKKNEKELKKGGENPIEDLISCLLTFFVKFLLLEEEKQFIVWL